MQLRGWRFWIEHGDQLHMGLVVPPDDNRHPGDRLDDFGDSFVVGADWLPERVIDRVFCHLQFLTDHELREQFTVDGVRVFEAHDPSVTGEQHDWFVERQSALRGY